MKIETKLSCGDKAWWFSGGHARQITVGQVRIEYTESAGLQDGEYFLGDVIANGGENHEQMDPAYKEVYMCIETGIGSGSLHTLGEHIFLTKEECLIAAADEIKRIAEAKAWKEKYDLDQLLAQEATVREKLARIEAAKAKVQS